MSPFCAFPLLSNNILLCFLILFLLNLNMYYILNSVMIYVNSKSLMMIIMSTVCFINLLGLIPYSISLLTYLWNSFIISLLYWFIFMVSCLLKYPEFTLSHLLPLGSPFFLWSFLVYLETISLMIRPLTLSLRLSCNLMAGHVIIFLVSNMSMNLGMLSVMLSFEVMVSIIQGFVYTLLNEIYMKELS